MDVAFVHTESGEAADFEKGRTGVDEPRDPLARRQLSARHMALTRLRGAALGRCAPPGLELVDEASPAGDVRLILAGWSAESALQSCHLGRIPRTSFPKGTMA